MSIGDRMTDTVKKAGDAIGKGATDARSMVGEGTKMVGDRIGDFVEITKLKARIADEYKLIDVQYLEIGEYFYDLISSGKMSCEDMQLRVDVIDQHLARIDDLEKAVEVLKEK